MGGPGQEGGGRRVPPGLSHRAACCHRACLVPGRPHPRDKVGRVPGACPWLLPGKGWQHLRWQTKSFREGWPRWRGLLAVCPARSSVAGQSAQQVTTQTFTPTTRKLETQRKAINLSDTLKMLRNKSGRAEASRETILKADLKT